MHIKVPLLLIRNSSPCGSSGFQKKKATAYSRGCETQSKTRNHYCHTMSLLLSIYFFSKSPSHWKEGVVTLPKIPTQLNAWTKNSRPTNTGSLHSLYTKQALTRSLHRLLNTPPMPYKHKCVECFVK